MPILAFLLLFALAALTGLGVAIAFARAALYACAQELSPRPRSRDEGLAHRNEQPRPRQDQRVPRAARRPAAIV